MLSGRKKKAWHQATQSAEKIKKGGYVRKIKWLTDEAFTFGSGCTGEHQAGGREGG